MYSSFSKTAQQENFLPFLPFLSSGSSLNIDPTLSEFGPDYGLYDLDDDYDYYPDA